MDFRIVNKQNLEGKRLIALEIYSNRGEVDFNVDAPPNLNLAERELLLSILDRLPSLVREYYEKGRLEGMNKELMTHSSGDGFVDVVIPVPMPISHQEAAIIASVRSGRNLTQDQVRRMLAGKAPR